MKFIKEHLLNRSHSRTHFFQQLINNGVYPEKRHGVYIGIKDGNKLYTWKKLGITPTDFERLDNRELRQRLVSIENKFEGLQRSREHNQSQKQDQNLKR